MPSAPATNGRAATWLRPDQVERLRTACYDGRFSPSLRQRNAALVTLLYDTGLRVGELVRLDVDNIDLEVGEVHVPTDERRDPRDAEASRGRTVVLDPTDSLGTTGRLESYLYARRAESAVLFPSRKGGRLTTKAVRDLITGAARTAAIRPYTPTGRGDPGQVSPGTLRHSTAWRLLEVEERSMADVDERLGHTARSTTSRLYAHFESSRSGSPAVVAEQPLAADLDESATVEDVLDAVPDVLYVFDTNGRLHWWNERLPAVTGFTDAEIATMHPLEFVPDDDTVRLAEAISRVVERGTVETRESQLVRSDGTHVPYEFNGAPLADDEGEVWGLVGAGRDIRPRRRAERAAEREQRRFDLFVEAVRDYAMFLLDPDGRIVSWNRGAERIKGYHEEEILGEHLSVLYPDAAVEEGVPGVLLEEAAAEGHVEDEGWRVREDGTRFWAHVTITALREDGELRGFAKVTRDLTERREREREIERQRDELERVNRINAVIRDIDQALVRATGRAAIEQAVCDRLATAEPYVGAWIGTEQAADRSLTPRSWAGFDEGAVESILDTVNDAGSGDWPSRRSLRTDEVHVTRDLPEEPAAAPCREVLLEHGCSVAIAVPIRYRETQYGVLVVYADDGASVGDRQRAVFAELGETVGHAIVASERREALVADSVVELTLEIRDPDRFFVQAATQSGTSATLEGIAGRREGSTLEYFTVNGVGPAELGTLANRIEHLDHVRIVDRDGDACLCEVGVSDASLVETVAEFGGTITDMTAEAGRGSVTVELPRSADAGRMVDALGSTVADVELRSKRTVDRPIRTDHRFRSTVDERLTVKQQDALETAYFAGFFEQPRLSTGEEIAESIGISPSTFHQHLGVGLRKLLAVVVETPPDEPA